MAEIENDKNFLNVAVIGSGPAAWTAALYLARANLQPLVFEGELGDCEVKEIGNILPGGQLMTTTEIENFPGFPNGGISGSEMMELFQKQAEEFGTQTISETVTQVKHLPSKLFQLTTRQKTYLVKSVILATGAQAKYLGLPSEQEFMNRGVSACATCDGALPRFRKQPIVVVGGGDTSAEESTFLARFASQVYLVHRRDQLRASSIMAKRVLENPKITVLWNRVVTEVCGTDKDGVTHVKLQSTINPDEPVDDLPCRGFFVAIGHQPNSYLVKDLVDCDESGYILTEGKTTYTKTPGLFACGDVQDKIYRQAITAAGSGCSAAIDCTRWLEEQELDSFI